MNGNFYHPNEAILSLEVVNGGSLDGPKLSMQK
jgi:hypothetical protein